VKTALNWINRLEARLFARLKWFLSAMSAASSGLFVAYLES